MSDPRDNGGYENAPYSDVALIPVAERLYRRIEAEIDTLKALGQEKNHALDRLNKARARAWLLVKTEHPEMSSDKLREAWTINQTEVGDLMLESDLADTIYRDQVTTIRALQSSVDLLRTMAASVRNATER